ncbi:hypothetical protein K2173_021785 [Erythroxylum novogranatense]|uniref:R13L1/DRL21-like LRR repeat region domain-containing protein n=1 Tax=Erythroxylum novogranatense TaxID=1862640 RepID=A0AAV8TXH3_9ROSI|nr:hypothetical protein K2173_021785 [Erythroxylum novogranatense]
MHDLMNDLAKIVAGEYCFRFKGKDPHELTSKTRYFSWVVTKQKLPDQLLAITKPQLWRTFITVYRSQLQSQCIAHLLTPGMFKTLERLRLLSLSRFENLYMLPNSIGCLKHLHYLDLSRTAICRLPESLCSLYNLETLKLENCFLLDELPTKLAKLVNMCHLDIRETRLQEMPPHMGKLIKLQKLTDFLVGKQGGSNFKELGKLLHIGGSLSIWNLRDVKHTQYACEANLKSKKHLKELTLEWKENTNDTMHDNAVLGGLQPHPDVERISLYGYGGMSFPDWLGDWCFTKLVSLELAGCQHCLSLPQLGHMVSLKYLTIREFNELVVIDDEFLENAHLPH